MNILPLATEPFTCANDRDMLPSERRQFVRTHRTCVFGTPRRADGPAMSVVYYVPTDTNELLVSTMRDRGKAKVLARNPKASLCVLDERWPFSYLQVYCDATVDDDPGFVVDVMMAVAGRMSGEPLGEDARPFVAAMAEEEHRVVLRCRPDSARRRAWVIGSGLDVWEIAQMIGGPLAKRRNDVLGLASDAALGALDDPQVLDLAAEQGRILVTRNARDFAPLLREWAEATATTPAAS